jgi:hypothetical protein
MGTIPVNHTCALVRHLKLQYGSRTLDGQNADFLAVTESDGPSSYNRRSSYYGGKVSFYFVNLSIFGRILNFSIAQIPWSLICC